MQGEHLGGRPSKTLALLDSANSFGSATAGGSAMVLQTAKASDWDRLQSAARNAPGTDVIPAKLLADNTFF